MQILILDDWESRHKLIKNMLAKLPVYPQLVHRYAPEQVSLRDWHSADIVFFDHDMCVAPEGENCPRPVLPAQRGTNGFNPDCNCPTGMNAVHALIASGAMPQCVVHSGNIVGGRRMAQKLKDFGFPVVWTPVITWGTSLPTELHKVLGLTR